MNPEHPGPRGRPSETQDPLPEKLDILTEPDAFEALASEWDALAERCGRGILHRHGFLRIWREHFAAAGSLRVLVQRADDGRLSAVLPLILRRTRIYGIAVRELGSMANVHSGRFDLLAENPPQAALAFLGLLSTADRWDVVCLIDVPQDGGAEALLEAAACSGLRTGRWTSMDSPYIRLPGSWNGMEQMLSRHFRANLRRRWRRLSEKGTVDTNLFGGGDCAELTARLNEGLELEAMGWKGQGGTAISQAPDTLGFYSTLARQAAREGRLRLWSLRLNDRAIAFQYGLQDGACYLLLKPAYDEAFSEVGPGHLLIEEVLKDCIESGVAEFDFLGPDMPWKRDWASTSRSHAWLYIFRGPRGRLVYWLKFRLAPQVRRLLLWWQELTGRQ